MIRFILNWIRRRRARKARDVFAFFDGQRTRRVDPFAIESGFAAHPTFAYAMFPLIEAGQREETDIFIGAICDVFRVRPWDPATETGLTKLELMRLFNDFDAYMESVKKKHNLGPILSAPMDSESPLPPADQSEITNLPSDSTSIEVESSCSVAQA